MRPLTTLLALALLFASIGCMSPFGQPLRDRWDDEQQLGPRTAGSRRLDATDIDILTGPPWTGTLTYVDYTSGKRTSIPCTLVAKRIAPVFENPTWELRVDYPKEPEAASVNTISLAEGSRGDRTIGDEIIKFRETLPNGGIHFITTSTGTDNGRPARFRFVHLITPTTYSRQKLVTYDGEYKEFERHIFQWTR